MHNINVRELVLDIIMRVETEKSFLNILVPYYLNHNHLISSDKALLQEITYGTIRFKRRLDWIIDSFLNKSKKNIPIKIRNILRMSVYQLFHLDRIPDYAICNEAVNLVKKSQYAGYYKLVNGILRNIIRYDGKFQWPDYHCEPIKYISVYYSFPEELIRRWIERYGFETCIKICQFSNQKPRITIRRNRMKISLTDLEEYFIRRNISFDKGLHLPEDAILVSGLENIESSQAFLEGYFSIQDESSMLTSILLDPHANDLVIDMCSGPGGKTTHLSQLMQNKGKIIAFEKNKQRLEMIKRECTRLGAFNVEIRLWDSMVICEELIGKADKVLLDAPCSGTGVIRKKPDLKWKKIDEMFLSKINKVQIALLETSLKYLKTGGEIVYSTCSMEKEENDELLQNFFHYKPLFCILDISDFKKKHHIIDFEQGLKEAIQLLPGYSGEEIDGFFMAKIKKVAG